MKVSFLIPAFRPTYLRQAIASALAQDIEDFEIIVSDDSAGDAIKLIVDRFHDPRIIYRRTAGRTGAVANCAALWTMARHDLIKYVFDDDLLMPYALPELLVQVERRPGASLYFGTRHIIDSRGRITTEAKPHGKPVFEVSGAQMVAALVPRIDNPIGEFTNVLMNRAVGITPAHFSSYEGFALHVLGDVALYLAACRLEPAVAVSRPVAAFRRHRDQQSSVETNPQFAIGLAEWELFLRGERSAGRLDQAQAAAGAERIATMYSGWLVRLPALRILNEGMAELRQRIEAADMDLLDAPFRTRWDMFIRAVLPDRR